MVEKELGKLEDNDFDALWKVSTKDGQKRYFNFPIVYAMVAYEIGVGS